MLKLPNKTTWLSWIYAVNNTVKPVVVEIIVETVEGNKRSLGVSFQLCEKGRVAK